jgi:Zn-dependent protease with chaperone function
MTSNRPSLLGRALLALALMIGFYVLAFGISLGLPSVVYAEVRYTHRISPKLALACLAGAGAILWSVIPRPDRFEPPGPRLEPAKQPRLFKDLRSVSESVGQTMPAEVYLIPDVNAWVSSRGGTMGIGSRRVMGVGLPLLQALSTAEFRAVLAHEFGHYHGGDTALAPWVYKTRVAIGRTLESLKDGILQLPFLWYGKLFMRVSHAVSRQQEYAADALAARVVGAGALIGGLKSVHRAAEAFQAYWRGEVTPVLSAGFRPPVAAGFAAFMNAEHISRETASSLTREIENPTASPYDTHPSLRDRIAALGGDKMPESGAAAVPAGSLLDDVDALECELLATIFPADAGRSFKNIDWSDTLTTVYLPAWESIVQAHSKALNDVRVGDLAELVQDAPRLVVRFIETLDASIPADQRPKVVANIIAAALTIALHGRDFPISCDVGYPIQVRIGSTNINPWSLISALAASDLARAQWIALVAANGLEDLELDSPRRT